jgi:hypothetical protein
MRKAMVIGALELFAVWFVWKAVPFLDRGRPAIYATPTVQPSDPSVLAPIAVKGGKRVCTTAIPWGPDARYVQFTLLGNRRRPNPAIDVVASGPGYRATAHLPPGAPGDQLQTLAIEPARQGAADGSLCLTNTGRHQVKFYGIAPGRGSGPSTTTVDGREIDPELSVTLLTHPSQSLAGRLGTLSSHIAAFRPLTGWEVFLLGLLAVLGVPAAVAFVLARAAALDDASVAAAPATTAPETDPGDQDDARARS